MGGQPKTPNVASIVCLKLIQKSQTNHGHDLVGPRGSRRRDRGQQRRRRRRRGHAAVPGCAVDGRGVVLQPGDFREDVGQRLVLRAPVEQVVPVVRAGQLLLAVDYGRQGAGHGRLADDGRHDVDDGRVAAGHRPGAAAVAPSAEQLKEEQQEL